MRIVIFCPFVIDYISTDCCFVLVVIAPSGYHNYHPIGEGCFRFDELLNHLNAFKCQKVVALGEDATCVIKKIQYDPNTNKLVGFVLPCDESGLPLCDSFMATTFESMENYFCNESVVNYTFVYMVQPLAENVPAFCLSCLGTNNKFDAEIVLKH